MSTIPSSDLLLSSLRQIITQDPSQGIPKLVSQLKLLHPDNDTIDSKLVRDLKKQVMEEIEKDHVREAKAKAAGAALKRAGKPAGGGVKVNKKP